MGKCKYIKGDTVVLYNSYGYIQEYIGEGYYRVLELCTYFNTHEYAVRSVSVPTGRILKMNEADFKHSLKIMLNDSTSITRMLDSFKAGVYDTLSFVNGIKVAIRKDKRLLPRTIEALNRATIFHIPTLDELEALPVADYWINLSDLYKLKEHNERRAA